MSLSQDFDEYKHNLKETKSQIEHMQNSSNYMIDQAMIYYNISDDSDKRVIMREIKKQQKIQKKTTELLDAINNYLEYIK